MDDKQLLKQYTDKIIKAQDLEIHPITNNLADAFTGEGYKQCSRYRKIKGTWVHVSGPKLNPKAVKHFDQ